MAPSAPTWLAVAAAFLALPIAAADADPAESTLDHLLLVRGGELVAASLDGETSRSLTKLRVPAADIRAIRSSVDGSAAIIQVDGAAGWIDLRKPAPPRYLPCSTAAQISADGDQVLCGAPDGERTVVYRTRGATSHRFLPLRPQGVEFAGNEAERVISGSNHGVLATPLDDSSPPTVVASEAPRDTLIVAPNGERAVGVFLDGDTTGVYTFRLDGKGARRKLMADATPMFFSRDSAWVVVQTERRACVLRVVGGEYKCWKGYQALGLSTHGNLLLLSRSGDEEGRVDIFAAELDGSTARRPRSLLSNAFPAVTFAPAPLGPGGGEAQSEVGAQQR